MEKGQCLTHPQKNEKNIASNYRPISLLPLFGKIFEKLIYDNLYVYINENNFITEKQSGYRRGDSTIKQLISITNAIHKTFDQGEELRAVFLDISRAFDRVWHEGLIFKLMQLGIEGKALNIIKDFLSDRQQRVAIDGQFSDWVPIAAGVPQGSILGPLLFLVFINDITETVTSNIQIFADDTFIYRTASDNSTYELNCDLDRITNWANQWRLQFNPSLSKQAVEIIFSRKTHPTSFPTLMFNGIPVKLVQDTQHLGMCLDERLSYNKHIETKIAKANQGTGIMIQLKKWISHRVLETIYKLFVRTHLDYGDVLYHLDNPSKEEIFEFTPKNAFTNLKKIEEIQYKAARIVSGAWKGTSYEKLYTNLGWESLNRRRSMRKLTILYETIHTKHPMHLHSIIKNFLHPENSRLANKYLLRNVPCARSHYPKQFLPSTIRDWNQLDLIVRESRTKPIFKNKILNLIRPKKSPYFGLFSNQSIKYITLLRLGLSPLNSHKFNHHFINTDEHCAVCRCTESTEHFLLTCPSYRLSRATLFRKVSSILDKDLSTMPRSSVVSTLLYGMSDKSYKINTDILRATALFIKETKRLDAI